MADPVRTEIKHLHAEEPARKGWERNEAYLTSLFRKLTEAQRIDVLVYAERLALKRITARLESSRARSKSRRRDARTVRK